MTKVAVYLLLRFFFTIFGADFSFGQMHLEMVLMPLAVVAILTMSLVAIYQDNVKRLLAYSSVAQIGYMVLGISFASVLGVTAGIIHLFNHALMKGALFMAMGCIMYSVGSVHIDKMAGLGKKMPWTMAALTYTPCGSQGSDNFPFPTPGLEPGETLVVPLPESGCYILGVIEPNACSIDMAPQTGELAPCETYEMVLDEDQFICPGN